MIGIFGASWIAALLSVMVLTGCASTPERKSANTVALRSWGNVSPRLLIDVPSTFVLKETEGEDFTVFYFTDQKTRDMLGIYVGHHPNGSTPLHVRKVRMGKISNIAVSWYERFHTRKFRSSTVVDDFFGTNAPRDYAGLSLHVFTDAKTRRGMLRLEKFAESLRAERSSGN